MSEITSTKAIEARNNGAAGPMTRVRAEPEHREQG